ncbi:ABC transporter [Brucella ceti M644/93/1]|uniref:ABC transporter n=1 Tax=Brucella ceti M644/93/1 TaxID=520459 RepID=A0ABM9Z907_9HYPH|nr:ABC transporter [Brucella ceti M13/05/1]EEX96145.1 ABC transporter [Brucella ceti M644/93/1]
MRKHWMNWASPRAAASWRARFRAAGSNGWRLPPASCTSRNCFCWTSQPRVWTPRRGVISGMKFIGWQMAASPFWFPPIIWMRWSGAIASTIFPMASCLQRARSVFVSGKRLGNVARELEEMPGVDQVAPFGATLHVVGSDREKLTAALDRIKHREDIHVEAGQTSLEDVFIQFMAGAKDNMQ